MSTVLIAVAGIACRAGKEATSPSGDAGPESPQSGGNAVLAVAADLTQVNELLAGGASPAGDVIHRLLFASLFEEQPGAADRPPVFAPSLAESVEWSADRRSARVRLRPGARWSDGAAITADDVRWTWQAQTDPGVAWDYSFVKEDIENVEVVAPHEVIFHFRRPSLTQMADLAEGVVLPRHAWSALPFAEWRQSPQWFGEHLVSSGPFTLEASPAGQTDRVFARNPRYFRAADGLPRLDRVVLRVTPERAAQRLQTLAGAFDYAEFIPPAEVERFAASPKARAIGYVTRQVNFIVWNHRRAPFDEARIRRALTLGIDRQALIDTLYRGHARLAVTPILSTIWARDPGLNPWPFDPAASRQALREAGFVDRDGDGIVERGGQPFRFELRTNAETQIRADAAALVADQLRRVGVDVRVRTLEISAVLAALEDGDFDATLLGSALDTSLDLRADFHSTAIAEGTNWCGYRSAEADRLLEAFQGAIEIEPARRLAWDLQALLHQDQPYTWLWEPERWDAVSRRLRGVEPNALSPWFHIEEWWISNRP